MSLQQFLPSMGPPLLPPKHYAWFRIANAHPSNIWKKARWFSFKERFLARFAVRDGFDLQIINIPCNRCDGEGCECCIDGIYWRKEIPLERWLFPNGDVYHCPNIPARPSVYRSQIEGYIKHLGYTERASLHAALKLFFRYDRSRFVEVVRATYGDKYWLRQLDLKKSALMWRFYCLRIRLHNKFFPPSNDVPF